MNNALNIMPRLGYRTMNDEASFVDAMRLMWVTQSSDIRMD